MGNMFLEREDVAILTGRRTKRHQADALRRMGIAFFINATGHPIVTRTAVEGKPLLRCVAKICREWTTPRQATRERLATP
jgi:hypothetical protein